MGPHRPESDLTFLPVLLDALESRNPLCQLVGAEALGDLGEWASVRCRCYEGCTGKNRSGSVSPRQLRGSLPKLPPTFFGSYTSLGL